MGHHICIHANDDEADMLHNMFADRVLWDKPAPEIKGPERLPGESALAYSIRRSSEIEAQPGTAAYQHLHNPAGPDKNDPNYVAPQVIDEGGIITRHQGAAIRGVAPEPSHRGMVKDYDFAELYQGPLGRHAKGKFADLQDVLQQRGQMANPVQGSGLWHAELKVPHSMTGQRMGGTGDIIKIHADAAGPGMLTIKDFVDNTVRIHFTVPGPGTVLFYTADAGHTRRLFADFQP